MPLACATALAPRHDWSAADGQVHREIYRGSTGDGGATWTWTALTANSRADHLRPIARETGDGRVIVIWQRGRYTTYRRYDLAVVGCYQ